MVPPRKMMKTYSQCTEKFTEKAKEGADYCVKAGRMDLERLNQCVGWMEALLWVRGIDPSDSTRPPLSPATPTLPYGGDHE